MSEYIVKNGIIKKNKKLIKIKKSTLFSLVLMALAVGCAFGHIWHLGQLAGI